MKTRHIIILLALISLQQCQCKKNDSITPALQCTSSNSVLVPQDMKDRFYFKDGTYWVYKNINTNALDSMWVWQSTISTSPVEPKIYGTGFNKCYESFYFKIKNPTTVNGDNYYSSITLTIFPTKGQSDSELFGIQDCLLAISPAVSYRIINRGGVYENDIGETMSMIDSIITGDNIVFKNILRLYYPTGVQTNDCMSSN